MRISSQQTKNLLISSLSDQSMPLGSTRLFQSLREPIGQIVSLRALNQSRRPPALVSSVNATRSLVPRSLPKRNWNHFGAASIQETSGVKEQIHWWKEDGIKPLRDNKKSEIGGEFLLCLRWIIAVKNRLSEPELRPAFTDANAQSGAEIDSIEDKFSGATLTLSAPSGISSQ